MSIEQPTESPCPSPFVIEVRRLYLNLLVQFQIGSLDSPEFGGKQVVPGFTSLASAGGKRPDRG